MGTATRFWNWNAERYSRQAIADEASYRKKLAITQKYLTPDMRVVEFGCGTGSTAIVHAPRVKTYDAIDVSEKMVEIARGKAAEAGLSNLGFTVGTLEEAALPDASCDAILGLNILHLVPDLDGTIATVARLLEPGGQGPGLEPRPLAAVEVVDVVAGGALALDQPRDQVDGLVGRVVEHLDLQKVARVV